MWKIVNIQIETLILTVSFSGKAFCSPFHSTLAIFLIVDHFFFTIVFYAIVQLSPSSLGWAYLDGSPL
jgi:hypothetical protein